MRILVFSYARLDHGGGPTAPRVIQRTVPALVDAGATVTIICPTGSGAPARAVVDGATVLPVLRFHEGSRRTPAEITADRARVAAATRDADVVWAVDWRPPGQLTIPWVYTLQTISWPGPVRRLLETEWSGLSVPSDDLLEVVRGVVGEPCWTPTAPPIDLIPNPLDTAVLAPGADARALRRRLGLGERDRVLLFPHRPDAEKGLDLALAALARLRAEDPAFRLLVPRVARLTDSLPAPFDAEVDTLARRHGVAGAVVGHAWIGPDDLTAYYALGECTLVLSRLPEGFGYTPVESIACGTPVVSTTTGALGGLLPPAHGVTHVPRDDLDAVVAAVRAPVPPADLARGRALVARRYAPGAAARGYLALFERARAGHATRGTFQPLRATGARSLLTPHP